MENSIEVRLLELGIALPAVPAPLANSVPFTLSGPPRGAIGAGSLPHNITVEIEAVLEIAQP